MPKILITGVAGFIGMHTAIKFLTEGWDVIGVDNLNSYYSEKLKNDRLVEIKIKSIQKNLKFDFYKEDLNSNIWDEFINFNIDAVIHLAAQAGVRYSITNPNIYLESNVLGFHKVLEFIRLKKIDKFLYASSSSVYGNDSISPFNEEQPCNHPVSFYAATKKFNELMAWSYWKTFGISSIGLRFFTVYGPWGRPDMAPILFATAAFKNESIQVFNHGNQIRDFTFIDDIVDSLYLFVIKDDTSKTPQVYNIGNGSPTSLIEFITTIEKLTGLKIDKQYIDAQVGDVESTYASTKKLESVIGERPRITLYDGMSKFISWFKKYYDFEN